jgi:tetratricopeptide (TPR) repeat protein
VWYGAHFKTKSAQVAQFLGEIYQNAGERVDDLIKSGASSQLTNDFAMAQAVLGDPARSELLHGEWSGTVATKTNSLAYRDLLWKLAQEQLDVALARRGSLSTPNLFMNRGRLLVREGKPDKAIPEFQNALALAKASSYELVRQETVTHALFAIGVAYWNLRSYKEAEEWLLKAQETQRKSGRVWVPTLDHDIERLKPLTGEANR